MKNKTRKLLSMVMALAMIVGMLTVPAHAAFEVGQYVWFETSSSNTGAYKDNPKTQGIFTLQNNGSNLTSKSAKYKDQALTYGLKMDGKGTVTVKPDAKGTLYIVFSTDVDSATIKKDSDSAIDIESKYDYIVTYDLEANTGDGYKFVRGTGTPFIMALEFVPDTAKHNITTESQIKFTAHGKDITKADEGRTVTVVSTDAEAAVTSITVVKSGEETTTVPVKGLTFVMPDYDVKVTAVTGKSNPAEEIVLDPDKSTMDITMKTLPADKGEEEAEAQKVPLSITVRPSDTTDDLKIKSSVETVATWEDNNIVVHAIGQTKITATAGEISKEVDVTVVAPDGEGPVYTFNAANMAVLDPLPTTTLVYNKYFTFENTSNKAKVQGNKGDFSDKSSVAGRLSTNSTGTLKFSTTSDKSTVKIWFGTNNGKTVTFDGAGITADNTDGTSLTGTDGIIATFENVGSGPHSISVSGGDNAYIYKVEVNEDPSAEPEVKTMTDKTVKAQTAVYDGKAHTIEVVTDPAYDKVTYSADGNDNYSDSKIEVTNVNDGTKTVYYKAEKADYADVKDSATISITQATTELKLSVDGDTTIKSESASGVTVNFKVEKSDFLDDSAVAITYGDDNTAVNNKTVTLPDETKTYTFTAKVTGNDNYTAATSEVKVQVISSTTKTYKITNDSAIITVNGVKNEDAEIEVVPTTSVTAEPKEISGKKFTEWTISGVTVADLKAETITFEMPENDVSVKANYDDVVTNKPVTKVTIAAEGGVTTLKVDESVTITATVTPDDATDQTLTWAVVEGDAIELQSSGKTATVTAKKVGTAKVQAQAAKDKVDSNVITITVEEKKEEEKPVAVTGVSLNTTSLVMLSGDEATLIASVAPADAANQKVTWKSSDAGVATVADGKVTAVAEGTATITVTTEDGGFTATCSVTVIPGTTGDGETEEKQVGYELTGNDLFAKHGGDVLALGTVFENEGTDGFFTFYGKASGTANTKFGANDKTFGTKGDEDYFEGHYRLDYGGKLDVTENGPINAVGFTTKGPATVKVWWVPSNTAGGYLAAMTGTNKDDAKEVAKFTPSAEQNQKLITTLELEEGGTYYVGCREQSGYIFKIRVTVTETVEVPGGTPVVLPESVSLNKSSLTLAEKATETLTATIAPENVTSQYATLTWSSSDETVATVADGVVTAVAEGTATITVTTVNGKTATCAVTVEAKQQGGDTPSGGGSMVPTTQGATTAGGSSSVRNEDGSTTVTKTAKDGTVTGTTTWPDGTKSVVTTSPEGEVTATVSVPEKVGKKAVSVPAKEITDTTVVVVVNPDGTETIVKASMVTDKGVDFLAEGNMNIKLVDNAKTFTDVEEGYWAKGAVDFVAAREIFNGVGDGTAFAPTDTVDRGMMATVLFRLADVAAAASKTSFADVAAGEWYSDAVAWANQTGVVTGYADGSFGPADAVTREQMATMLYRYAKVMGLDTEVKGNVEKFSDAASVSSWASDAMAWAVGVGLINGVGDPFLGTILSPATTASRAEVATIMQRMVKLMLQ